MNEAYLDNGTHLSEDTLNMYLDGELKAQEQNRIEAHLAACETCQAEVRALKTLFDALDELELTPATNPDLVPGVMAQVRPRRRIANAGQWLIPTLQTIATLALIAWGWTRLIDYWTVIGETLPLQSLQNDWSKTIAWATAQGAALLAWPTTAWNTLQERITQPAGLGDLQLTLTQLTSLGTILLAFWVIGNVVLLRRALLNGHVAHKEALR